MNSEQELINILKDFITQKRIGLFSHNSKEMTEFKYVCDLPFTDDLANSIIMALKDPHAQDYLYIQKLNDQTLYVQMENKFFSLSKEITGPKEKVLFYHKVPPKNPNPLSIEQQMRNALKKIA